MIYSILVIIVGLLVLLAGTIIVTHHYSYRAGLRQGADVWLETMERMDRKPTAREPAKVGVE